MKFGNYYDPTRSAYRPRGPLWVVWTRGVELYQNIMPKRARAGATISSAHPDEADLRSSEALLGALGATGSDDVMPRAEVLATQLQRVVATWVCEVGFDHGLNAEQAAEAGQCPVLMLGSCALGVPVPGSDLDVVAVVPYFVERSHFFAPDGLCARLREVEGFDPASLHRVSNAFVPVIKFVLSGLSIDLLLARVRLPAVPDGVGPANASSLDAICRKCIEETDVHSLNGARVACAILRRVPDTQNFQHTLRAVKRWAQRRGVDQQASGFPGGVAWALLTARVCQLHPNAAPATLLAKFFATWHVWRFGSNAVPVLLEELDEGLVPPAAGADSSDVLPPHLMIADWNPRDKKNTCADAPMPPWGRGAQWLRAAMLPILSPVPPSQSSTGLCRKAAPAPPQCAQVTGPLPPLGARVATCLPDRHALAQRCGARLLAGATRWLSCWLAGM